MDPLTWTTVIAGGLSAGATVFGAKSQSDTMKAEAAAGEQRAQIEGQWAERRAMEERASAQRQAGEEQRKARLAQSRLGAVAGASGAGSSDPSVMTLFEGIGREGDYNAAAATAAGEQKAAGLSYQSALDRWTADTGARIKRAGAKSTLIGGFLNASANAGQFAMSRMAARYGSPTQLSPGGTTGYGGR